MRIVDSKFYFSSEPSLIEEDFTKSSVFPAQRELRTIIDNKEVQRIIGGRTTSIDEAPYMAAVLRNGQLVCGGSIVSIRFVVSAAHCFYK